MTKVEAMNLLNMSVFSQSILKQAYVKAKKSYRKAIAA
jgi:hypothetical protein